MTSIQTLNRAYKVDQAINYATKNFVIIRFGVAADGDCQKIDKWIETDAADISDFAKMYKVEKKNVPELVARYSLSGPCSIIFFHNGSVVRRLSADILKKEKDDNHKTFGNVANKIKDDVSRK